MSNETSIPGFAARARRYLKAAGQAAETWFDADGQWRLASTPLATRERFWIAFGLYASGRAALADAVIRRGETERFAAGRYNIFDTNIAAALRVQHGARMAPDVREKLESLVRDGFNFRPGNRQPDYQFHGYNDNMPAKATMGLVLGGELLGDADALAYGLWDLRQLRAMLVRRGLNSEFNSPTYSPLTVHAMGEIAEHAQNAEARRLARGIEARLWVDFAARFHPETGILAGPYARAYTIDTIGHVSLAATLLWLVLGDVARPSPMLFFDLPDDLVLHHMHDVPFNIAQMCWLAAGSFHVPAAALKLFGRKKYPYRAVASCELGDYTPDFPARPCRVESYLREDFTLGTSSTSFCGGEQTMSYFVTYRRRAKVRSFRDVGTVFSKLVVNGAVPGTERVATGAEGGQERAYSNRGEEDCLTSRANTLVFQRDATALVVTHPQLSLGGAADTGAGAKPLSDLSELVIFPSHHAGVDELLVAGVPRAEWGGPVERGQWVVCRRGRLLIGLRPLVYTRTLGPVTLSLEAVNNYQFLRARFHGGAERVFTRAELRHCFGGFVAEHASVDDFASAAEFAAALGAGRFTDYFFTTRRVRYRRPALGRGAALDLEVSVTPGSQQTRVATINGQPIDLPRARYDGVAERTLPFLAERYQPVPPFFPWRDLRVEWGDWAWAISDREDA